MDYSANKLSVDGVSAGQTFNMIGISNYFSIQVVLILLAAMILYLLRNILERRAIDGWAPQKLILAVFFIPAVFLRTSVDLCESFIMAEVI